MQGMSIHILQIIWIFQNLWQITAIVPHRLWSGCAVPAWKTGTSHKPLFTSSLPCCKTTTLLYQLHLESIFFNEKYSWILSRSIFICIQFITISVYANSYSLEFEILQQEHNWFLPSVSKNWNIHPLWSLQGMKHCTPSSLSYPCLTLRIPCPKQG